jgi:hypothetical protein
LFKVLACLFISNGVIYRPPQEGERYSFACPKIAYRCTPEVEADPESDANAALFRYFGYRIYGFQRRSCRFSSNQGLLVWCIDRPPRHQTIPHQLVELT